MHPVKPASAIAEAYKVHGVRVFSLSPGTVATDMQRKIKAKQTRLITEPEPEEDKPAKESNIVDLMALLRESMERRGATAPAAKAAKSAKTPARKAAHEPARKKRASA